MEKAYLKIHYGGLAVALVDNALYPEGKGNALVIITGFANGKVQLYHPGYWDPYIDEDIDVFIDNIKVLWAIY